MTRKDITKISHELSTAEEIFEDFYDEMDSVYRELSDLRVTRKITRDPQLLVNQVAQIIDELDEALDLYHRGFRSNVKKVRVILATEDSKLNSRSNNLSA